MGLLRFSVFGLCLLGGGCAKPSERIVLYCAQDREFAEGLLADFTRQTGIEVAVKYDTEANKSVSLYAELVQEKARPRCDVHWNNEILSTIRLQKLGILSPYKSPASKGYPAYTQATDGAWQAFAARARVILVNTTLVPLSLRPATLDDLTSPRWAGMVAIAKPQFGTTATHAACLFEVLGGDATRQFYLKLKANQVQLVAGNKQVAEGVGQGRFAIGITDTDDALCEVESGKPVAIIFPDRDAPSTSRMGTLFIPNTVAVIANCPNRKGAERLVDFLLSESTERILAEGPSHQLPLGLKVEAVLPACLETPKTVRPMKVDFEKAASLWDEAQEFLREEFARP